MITETIGREHSLEQHVPLNAHKAFGFDPTLAEQFLLRTNDDIYGIKQGQLQGVEGVALTLDLHPYATPGSSISELERLQAFERKKERYYWRGYSKKL